MFKDPFSFYGRIRRTEFGLTYVFYLICYFFVLIFSEKGVEWIGVILLLPFYLMVSQGAKRCHDLGKSGWWQLIPFLWISDVIQFWGLWSERIWR